MLCRALATRLQVIGTCQPTVAGVSEKALRLVQLPYRHMHFKTASVSAIAVAVRGALRKASEPGRLFFHDLPSAAALWRKMARSTSNALQNR